MAAKYDSNSVILVDKEYTGLVDQLCVIIPSKKPNNGWLSVAERTRKCHIASDRVLIENCFGRFCSFNLFRSKWKWSENIHNESMKLGVAVTNAHVILHPILHDDETHYGTLSNLLKTIGGEHTSKRTLSRTAHPNRRRRRLSECFSQENFKDDEDINGTQV